jgi:hypothetical protein
MRVTSDDIGRKIDIDDLSQRLRFSPECATKPYDTIAPGTAVIVTDQPAVRNPTSSPSSPIDPPAAVARQGSLPVSRSLNPDFDRRGLPCSRERP